MDTKREAIEFLNGMRDQFIDQKKIKSSSDLKVISAIGLVCVMAEESLKQQQQIERLKGEIEKVSDKLIKYENCLSCKYKSECDNENKSSIHVCYMWAKAPDAG